MNVSSSPDKSRNLTTSPGDQVNQKSPEILRRKSPEMSIGEGSLEDFEGGDSWEEVPQTRVMQYSSGQKKKAQVDKFEIEEVTLMKHGWGVSKPSHRKIASGAFMKAHNQQRRVKDENREQHLPMVDEFAGHYSRKVVGMLSQSKEYVLPQNLMGHNNKKLARSANYNDEIMAQRQNRATPESDRMTTQKQRLNWKNDKKDQFPLQFKSSKQMFGGQQNQNKQMSIPERDQDASWIGESEEDLIGGQGGWKQDY